MVVCDGYAIASNNSPPAKGGNGKQQPVFLLLTEAQQLVSPDICSNFEESRLFRQFRNHAKNAFSSLGPVEFWNHYVVPLAITSEPVRYASIAVAAAHQLFMFRSAVPATSVQTPQLENIAIQQYNKAIGCIKTLKAVETSYDMQCVLTCCLLFVCLESMSGRYSESIRHFRAGTQLLASLQTKNNAEDQDIAEEIAEMFARFGIGISIFMEEAIMPRRPSHGAPLQTSGGPGVPFSSLNEASLALRQIDVYYVNLMFSGSNLVCEPPSAGKEKAFDALEDRLTIWSSRFDATVEPLQFESLSDADQEQVMRLRLTQRMWQLFVPCDATCHSALASSSFLAFLDEAENLAEPFIAMKCPTFAVDGDLVSGLSLVTTLATDVQIRSRALDLLRSLNRREGVWDSREIIELHEATLSHEDSQYWYTREVEGGIPGYMRLLAGATPTLNTNNAILRMTTS